jgi:hypothetical protein
MWTPSTSPDRVLVRTNATGAYPDLVQPTRRTLPAHHNPSPAYPLSGCSSRAPSEKEPAALGVAALVNARSRQPVMALSRRQCRALKHRSLLDLLARCRL